MCHAVCLAVKPVGEPDTGNRYVRFDERGWETGRWPLAPSYRAHPRLYQPARHRATAPPSGGTMPVFDRPRAQRCRGIRPHGSGRSEAHEDHQSFRPSHVGTRSDREAAPHRPRDQGQERRDAHSRRDRHRAHRHRRGAGIPADRRGHRRPRAFPGSRGRGPDVLRAHLREDVQRLAECAGTPASVG